jgi:uncharacterized protein YbaA (DUF1428 family)
VQTYMFYPYRVNGAALVFQAADLADLAAAAAHAAVLLTEHQTADLVEVWEGDVLHQTVRRAGSSEG